MFALAHFEIAHWKDIFPENFFIPKSTPATVGPRLTNFPTASRKPIATLPAYDFFLINPHRKWRHLDQILKKHSLFFHITIINIFHIIVVIIVGEKGEENEGADKE